MRLGIPTIAVKPKQELCGYGHGAWHFQRPDRLNRTICNMIIASGRGWKDRSKKSRSRYAGMWERKKVSELHHKRDKVCSLCKGAMVILGDQLDMFGEKENELPSV